MQATRLIVPEVTLSPDLHEVVLARLHESHDLSAYEAVERLVQAGKAAGIDTNTLLGMIDKGMPFHQLLDLIASKASPSSGIAPLESKGDPEFARPSRTEKTPDQLLVA